MVIIGILAAVSIPRFTNVVRQSEAASEQGVLINMVAALDTYSHERFIEDGVLEWPDNPFDGLDTKPTGYTTDATDADVDGEWTYNTTSLKITHQRNDNSRVGWAYAKGTQTGDAANVGTLGARASL